MIRTLYIGAVLAALAWSGASGAQAQPPSAVTALELTVVGGPALNPSAQGSPRPVIVRIFELAAAPAFESADYGALFENPGVALKRDIVSMEEIVLRPGDIQERNRDIKAGARLIGVAAAFRDMADATWHLTVPLKVGQRNFLLIHLDGNRIRFETPDSK